MAGDRTPWLCWCGPSPEDEEEEWKRRKREQLLECLRRVKGLSLASHRVLRTEAAYVLDEVERKLFGDLYSYFCGNNCGTGGFGNSFCLLVWLGVYAGTMLTLQFRLYKLVETTLLSKGWSGANSWLRVLEKDYVTEFHVYYSASIGLMILVMSSAFLSARNAFLGFLQKMTRQLVNMAQNEMRTEIRDSIDCDFYAFINRLPQYFSVSSDFSKLTVRRIHRLLHTDLDTRICMMDYDMKGPLSIGREVQKRVATRVCCCSFFFFFLPWFATVVANVCLVAKVFAVTYGLDHEVQVQKPDVITTGDYNTALRDEGTQFIGYALLVNLVAWLYLAILQLHCVTFSILYSLYTRICVGIVLYCDRLVLRIWDEAVLCNVADYIDDVKTNVEFSEEQVRIPVSEYKHYDAIHPHVPKRPFAEGHREVISSPRPPSESPHFSPPSAPERKIHVEPMCNAPIPPIARSSYSMGSPGSDGHRSALTEPLVMGRTAF